MANILMSHAILQIRIWSKFIFKLYDFWLLQYVIQLIGIVIYPPAAILLYRLTDWLAE